MWEDSDSCFLIFVVFSFEKQIKRRMYVKLWANFSQGCGFSLLPLFITQHDLYKNSLCQNITLNIPEHESPHFTHSLLQSLYSRRMYFVSWVSGDFLTSDDIDCRHIHSYYHLRGSILVTDRKQVSLLIFNEKNLQYKIHSVVVGRSKGKSAQLKNRKRYREEVVCLEDLGGLGVWVKS